MDDDWLSESYFSSLNVLRILYEGLNQIFLLGLGCSSDRLELNSKLHRDLLVSPFFGVCEGISDRRQLILDVLR